MEYEKYVQLTRQVAHLVEAGDYKEALAILRSLLTSDLADRDKAMMCLNMAVVYDKLGETAEVLRWYDEGIGYERGQGQSFVAESKAAYLVQRGRISEGRELYEALLKQPGLGESDKERLRENIRRLEGH